MVGREGEEQMQSWCWKRSFRKACWRLAIALALLATAGCGSGGPPATGAGQPVAAQTKAPAATRPAEPTRADEQESSDIPGCERLTKDEVAAAMGEPVTGTEDYGLAGCEWRTGERTQVLFDIFAGSALAPATCAAQRSLGTGREEDVPGLGDSALWKSSRRLVVCTSKAVIVFNLDNTPNSPDKDKEAAVKMARLVLGRL